MIGGVRSHTNYKQSFNQTETLRGVLLYVCSVFTWSPFILIDFTGAAVKGRVPAVKTFSSYSSYFVTLQFFSYFFSLGLISPLCFFFLKHAYHLSRCLEASASMQLHFCLKKSQRNTDSYFRSLMYSAFSMATFQWFLYCTSRKHTYIFLTLLNPTFV